MAFALETGIRTGIEIVDTQTSAPAVEVGFVLGGYRIPLTAAEELTHGPLRTLTPDERRSLQLDPAFIFEHEGGVIYAYTRVVGNKPNNGLTERAIKIIEAFGKKIRPAKQNHDGQAREEASSSHAIPHEPVGASTVFESMLGDTRILTSGDIDLSARESTNNGSNESLVFVADLPKGATVKPEHIVQAPIVEDIIDGVSVPVKFADAVPANLYSRWFEGSASAEHRYSGEPFSRRSKLAEDRRSVKPARGLGRYSHKNGNK